MAFPGYPGIADNSESFFLALKVILSLNASRVCTVPLKLISLGKIPNKEAD
jgi:hypothetical protein